MESFEPQMRISVVVPTFNRAHTFPRALDSILCQSLPATEIIVVDDGSQDDTADLIRHRYPQVRYLWQPNGGVSSSRNRGIGASGGDWIAFLDSDDAWFPDKLMAQCCCPARASGQSALPY